MNLAFLFGFVIFLNFTAGLPNGKIIGGDEVVRGEVPFIAQIIYSNQHLCGGVIISSDWILTAAQCAEFGVISEYTVVGGQHSLENIDDFEQISTISEIHIHPGWNSQTMENDLALIKLSNKLKINVDFVSPLILPPDGSHIPPTDSEAIAYGWGILEENDQEMSDILRKVSVQIVSDESCKSVYSDTLFDEIMMCAGTSNGGKDSCNGDAGGPLVCTDLDKPYLCGLVSWGIGCGRPGIPGVYTEISAYIDWIKEIVSLLPEQCQDIPMLELTPDTYIPQGDIINIDGLTVYEGADKSSDKLLIIVHDIYGFDSSTNTMQFADKMNQNGFRVAFPDYFYAMKSDKNLPNVHSQEWIKNNWAKNKQQPTWEGSVRADTEKVLNHYKAEGITKFGIFGFCWGGKIALRASTDLGVDLLAAGQVHPSSVVESDAELAMTPNILLPAQNDAQMENYCEIIKGRIGLNACYHQRFTDVNHGFSGQSGNWSVPLIKQRAEEVVQILSTRFCQYMN